MSATISSSPGLAARVKETTTTKIFSVMTIDASGNIVPTQTTVVSTMTTTRNISTAKTGSTQLSPLEIGAITVSIHVVVLIILTVAFITVRRRWRQWRARRAQRVEDAERQEVVASEFIPPPPNTAARNVALEKENLALQDRIHDMSESMNRMQRELEQRPEVFENDFRGSVLSVVSEDPPEYRSVVSSLA
ncbi:hypothetical protein DL96DRAFT_1617034 [Flagelloscypha sp. PMI_526]|nr:hypothetical protein DL96DRAFT_1617034 [Flagelloscypha sp. PMI_526]